MYKEGRKKQTLDLKEEINSGCNMKSQHEAKWHTEKCRVKRNEADR